MKTLILAAIAALFVVSPSLAAELRVVPGAGIFATAANDRGYNELTVDGVVIVTAPDEAIRVDSVRIDLMSGSAVLSTRMLRGSDLVASTSGLASAGFVGAVESQVLNPDGLRGLFGRAATLASSVDLSASTALIASPEYFAINAQPDAVRVSALYHDAARRQRSVTATVPVVRYASLITYKAPLTGAWFQSALPSLTSHHRLNPSTAFAIDFFKINERGELFSGDRQDPSNYFGYGAPVLAAADGVVVRVVSEEVQDRAAMLPREGESRQQAGQRIGQYMTERMARDFRRASAGNLIVIRHQSGNTVEYSAYGHLRAGSVRVSVGQSVRQGNVIAEVGDTGDSASVHLHFQVNTGDDPFTSQSLPVQFSNLPRFPSELGRMVTPNG